MAGWNLKYGELKDYDVSDERYWLLFNFVFSDSCRKRNTYKFGLIKSILDNLFNGTDTETGFYICKWDYMANVTIEYNRGVTQKFRLETFCYRPKSCDMNKMGRPRAGPYKDCGSSYSYDEDWLDDICTENRGDEE